MPITAELEEGNISVLKISGVLQPSEIASVQDAAKRQLQAGGGGIKLLVLLEDFRGWQKGADWNDATFYFEHGDDVKQIAFVGDPRWETEALMFVGAGLRRAPVKYFQPAQEAEARSWLSGPG